MERHRTVLIIIAVIVTIARPERAQAQYGACPTGTISIPVPAGTWPGTVTMCADPLDESHISVGADADEPCDQQLHFYNLWTSPITQLTPTLYIVPPTYQYLSWNARIVFYVYDSPAAAGAELLDSAFVRVRYYTKDRLLYSTMTINVTDATSIVTTYTNDLIPQLYNVYIFDITLPTDDGLGYFTFKYDPGEGSFQNAYRVASWQAGSFSAPFPETCPIPNAVLPQTPTPQPTSSPLPTPTGTYTPPTATPTNAAYPTAAASTPQPTSTQAPLVFPTINSESTPTPWPAYVIPPIAWPTAGPTIMAGALPTLDVTGLDLSGLADDIQGDWAGALASSQAGLDTTISTTTGIAAPDTIATEITQGIGKPIAYAKTIGLYAPNVAGYVTRFMYLAAWVVFSRNARFFLSIVVKIFELIRRVWEMIPFVG